MNDLGILAIVLAPVVFLLYVIARVATNHENELPQNEHLPYYRRQYYFLELIGKEVGLMAKNMCCAIQKFFR